MDPKVETAFNEQMNREFYSSFVYLSVAAFLEAKGLKGMASWVRARAAEENVHAFKFYDFVNERGGRVRLGALDGPPTEWDSVKAAFAAIYEHECFITRCINGLVVVAKEVNDNSSEVFLQWFVTEQVEEEASTKEMVDKLSLIGDNGMGLYLLDRELGEAAAAMPGAPAPDAT